MRFRADRLGPAIRLALARRPWIRWLAIGLAALATGWIVVTQLQRVDDARSAWTERRTVFVATHDHVPGETLAVDEQVLPAAAIPATALDESPAGGTARQRIAAGEVLTAIDIAHGAGPAATADDGQIVIAVSDPLLVGAMSSVSVGLEVAVHSEGIVLAEQARVAAIDGDVVFVALDPEDAAGVSAAAQTRLASLAFLR